MARKGRKKWRGGVGTGFANRLRKVKERAILAGEDITEAEAAARVKASYRGHNKAAIERQNAGLTPGWTAAERQESRVKKELVNFAGTGIKRDELAEVSGLNIVQFAEGWLGLTLHPAQRVILKVIYGMRLYGDEERAIYEQITGLKQQHGVGHEAVEIVLALGARSGKSFLTSVMALYEAIVHGLQWRGRLQPGEIGYAVVIATRQKQAEDIIQKNCARLLESSEKLRDWLIEDPKKAELSLKNGLKIISLPCNSTAGRGLPNFFLAFDEMAHFFTEGVKADEEIFNALFPRQAQFPGAKCAMISTPAAKQGLFWKWFADGFETPGRFTAQAPTRVINPTISDDFFKRAEQHDPDNYAREFLAQFAEKLEMFFPADKLAACMTLAGDTAPRGHVYACGIDQSGLTGRDRFALAVAHQEENGKVLVDVLRSWDTSDFDDIEPELVELARRYGLASAVIDNYAKGWVEKDLNKLGLEVVVRDALPKVYQNTKSLMIAGKLALPDDKELKEGMVNTSAYYGRNNAVSIAHDRSSKGHADLADAVCTAVWAVSGEVEEPAYTTQAGGWS